ncbi:MAG: hypothetical protein JW925_12845 [Syntrophaceae bacterium]|nr:hypothetical protein [Syntrophaceae bacterium]
MMLEAEISDEAVVRNKPRGRWVQLFFRGIMRKIFIILFLLLSANVYLQENDFLSKYFGGLKSIGSKMISLHGYNTESSSTDKSIVLIIKPLNENLIGFFSDESLKPLFIFNKLKNTIIINHEFIETTDVELTLKESIISIDEISLSNIDYGDYYYFEDDNIDFTYKAWVKIAKKGNQYYFCYSWNFYNKDASGKYVEAWLGGYVLVYNQK